MLKDSLICRAWCNVYMLESQCQTLYALKHSLQCMFAQMWRCSGFSSMAGLAALKSKMQVSTLYHVYRDEGGPGQPAVWLLCGLFDSPVQVLVYACGS